MVKILAGRAGFNHARRGSTSRRNAPESRLEENFAGDFADPFAARDARFSPPGLASRLDAVPRIDLRFREFARGFTRRAGSRVWSGVARADWPAHLSRARLDLNLNLKSARACGRFSNR